jgi:hypothetical protein
MTRATLALLIVVAIGAAQPSAFDRRPLGEIDFFGYKGLDVAAIRAALPFHEADSFPSCIRTSRAVAFAAFSENLGVAFLHRSSAPFVTNLMEAFWRPRERRDEMPLRC